MMTRPREFPNLKVIADPEECKDRHEDDWGAVCFAQGELFRAPVRKI
jgi:hypothetical protein